MLLISDSIEQTIVNSSMFYVAKENHPGCHVVITSHVYGGLIQDSKMARYLMRKYIGVLMDAVACSSNNRLYITRFVWHDDILSCVVTASDRYDDTQPISVLNSLIGRCFWPIQFVSVDEQVGRKIAIHVDHGKGHAVEMRIKCDYYWDFIAKTESSWERLTQYGHGGYHE